MNATYFPGANTGLGFVNRFDGILSPWERQHYAYVLKGGPGVGKSTLMRKVAARAAEQGYGVEEFRCAGDPDSLDAVRVPALRVVLLDGTAPHTIDPILPGIADEVIDLGHFLHREVFAQKAETLRARFAENKTHYARAYACLGAASALMEQAVAAAEAVLELPAVHKVLAPLFVGEQIGESRRLFAASATPRGVLDYTDTLGLSGVRRFGGVAGRAILRCAARLAQGRAVTLLGDFLLPDVPRCILLHGASASLCLGDAAADVDAAASLCKAPLPDFAVYAEAESAALVSRAITELAVCRVLHDEIEEIYRPFVDYDRVNAESDALLARIGL